VGVILLTAAHASAQATKQLYAVAVDRAHSPVTDLQASDFAITEDGVARKIARATLASEPMRIVLDVDSSEAIEQSINPLRAGLQAFLDTLPVEHEVAFVSTGRQSRVRVAPTSDRARLKKEAAGFFTDGGGAAILDSLLETYDRFLKKAPGKWPVWVIVTTDGAYGGSVRDDDWGRFLKTIETTDAVAHAVVWSTRGNGIGTIASLQITEVTGGHYEAIAAATALPDKMKALATLLAAHHQQASTQYRIEYFSDAKNTKGVEVEVKRPGTSITISQKRQVQ
jgi:hypothetical protein